MLVNSVRKYNLPQLKEIIEDNLGNLSFVFNRRQGRDDTFKVQTLDEAVSGTPATGVTAIEKGDNINHYTKLEINSTLPDIAGGAALAVGTLVYTFPAGIIHVKSVSMNMALDENDGNITADTPDVGIGTTIASGAVAVLGGTAAFENMLTGQTATNSSGTKTTKALSSSLIIEASDNHTVYFNVADTWAASGEDDCPILGTIDIEWTLLN